IVSTQCIKYKAKRSSSVDTSPGSVNTRDSSQNTFWSSWDSVSTLAQERPHLTQTRATWLLVLASSLVAF
ncbi:hypothetical protein Taro_055271, partial [Colocasia esculenta]|nr:hypothetical protein [Colocasia esculenta]